MQLSWTPNLEESKEKKETREGKEGYNIFSG